MTLEKGQIDRGEGSSSRVSQAKETRLSTEKIKLEGKRKGTLESQVKVEF